MNVIQPSIPSNWLDVCANMFGPTESRNDHPLSWAWDRVLRLLSSGAGLHDVELALRKVTRRFQEMMMQALREALQQLDDRLAHPPCPHCTRPMWRNRLESLTLQFLEGEISLLRRYSECRPCGIHLHPLDVWLGLPEKGECTPQFGQDLCLLSIHLPAQTAVDVLAAITGRRVGRSALQQYVERDGDALVALEREEAAGLWPWDEKNRIRALEPLGGLPLRKAPVPGDVLIIEMDGVFANIGREPSIIAEFEEYEALKKQLAKAGKPPPSDIPSRFREVRQARLYRLEDRVTKKTRTGGRRTSLSRSETVSVVNDPEYFRRRVQAVTHSWQATKYKRIVVLGDGGDFVWEVSRTIVNATIEVLDVQHARSHIHACGRALYGDGNPGATAWGRQWSTHVYDSGPDGLLAELTRLKQQGGPASAERVLTNLLDYVTKHRLRMDYPGFRALGLPIASGAIESANRQVVGDRCKRSGMRWTRDGLQRILSLRAAYLSGNWEHVFAAIRAQRAIRTPVKVRLSDQAGHEEEARRGSPPACQVKSQTTAAPDSLPDIPARKIPELLRSGFLKRTADGKLVEARVATA